MRAVAIVTLVACGARSALDRDPTRDASPPDAVATAYWTFIEAGYPTALAVDDGGNPFVAIQAPSGTAIVALDALTKEVKWRSDLGNGSVAGMAYGAGVLYVTGTTPPGHRLHVGAATIDLPLLDSDWASYVAQIDASDGHTRWLVSPDSARTPLAPAGSRCFGIAAAADGSVVTCGYWGARFGLEPPYLPDKNWMALFRLTRDAGVSWTKLISGDPLGGHVYVWRRSIDFDDNGDVWLVGVMTPTAPLVDESKGVLVISPVGEHDDLYPYVLRIQSVSRTIGPARSFPSLILGFEPYDEVPSMDVAGSDIFLAGTATAIPHPFYAFRLDESLATRWEATGTTSAIRGAADGHGGLNAGVSDRTADLARFDSAGALTQRHTIATAGCAQADACPTMVQVVEVRADRAHDAVYVLGVGRGRLSFDDGTVADSPGGHELDALAFLARRPAL